MDETQFHDFLASAPLDSTTLESLRRALPKGQLTPTRLTAMLKDGSLPLDPTNLVERHFDVSVSIAGWGERELALSLPKGTIALEAAQRYLDGDLVAAWETDRKLVLELGVEDETLAARDPREWLPALLPLRAKLLAGDPRPLYLGWLADCVHGELADTEREPPVPAGLGALDAPLVAMAEFLAIPAGLLAAAASASPPLEADRNEAAHRRWLATTSASAREGWLLRAMGDGPLEAIREELRALCASSTGTGAWPMAKTRRTAGELRRAGVAGMPAAARPAVAAPRSTARSLASAPAREGVASGAQASHASPPREPPPAQPIEAPPWAEVERVLVGRRSSEYQHAARLLRGIQQAFTATGTPRDYPDRLRALLAAHSRKAAWLAALDEAGVQR